MNRRIGMGWVLCGALAAGCGDDAAETTSTGAGGDGGTAGATSSTTSTTGGGGEASCFGTETDDPMLGDALDLIRDFLAENDVPGGAAIAIVKDGQTLGVGTTGSKTALGCDPITEDTLMLTTTSSEIITALALLDAVEEGKITLDTKITSIVPLQTPPSPHGSVDDITLAHLLTHTSGYRAISDQWYTFNTCTTLEDSVLNPEVPLLYWAPGSMHAPLVRSNTEIAGFALEQIDGVSFEDAVRARVLDPLGMGGLYDKEDIEASDHALGHFNGFTDVPVEGCANRHPSDGYYGSVRDMTRLLEALTGNGGDVLEPATLEMMLSPQGVNFWASDYTVYGFDDGWHDDAIDDDILVAQSSMTGNVAFTFLFRERRLAVTLMLNVSPLELMPQTVQPEELDELLNALFVIADRTLSFVANPPYVPTPEDIGSVLGTYADTVGFNAEGARAIEVSVNPDDPTALIGVLTAFDGSSQSVDLTGFICSDNFAVDPSLHGQVARFWRDAKGDADALTFGADGGPPFYRLGSP